MAGPVNGLEIGNEKMRFATPPLALLSSRSEKEAKLAKFIAEGLTEHDAEGPGEAFVTLVARSLDSPVARALHAALAGRDGTAPHIRVILMDTAMEENAQPSLLDTSNGTFRVLRDQRFGDAHEQLVLSATRDWMGDCMRRDPTKRDAFEVYRTGFDATHTARSFEMLWALAEPLQRVAPQTMTPAVIVAELAAALPANARGTQR